MSRIKHRADSTDEQLQEEPETEITRKQMPEATYLVTKERFLTPCSFQDILDEESNSSAAWIDVTAIDAEQLRKICTAIGLNPLAIEACLDAFPAPGLVVYGKSLFIGLPYQTEWNSANRAFLRIVCLPSVLLSIHESANPALQHVAENYSGGMRFHRQSVSALLYQILDHVIDADISFTLQTREAVDSLEKLLENGNDDRLVDEALPIKRNLSRLAATFEDQLYCVGMLQTIESESFDGKGLREHFRDAVSHLEHAGRSLSRQAAHLAALQQQHQLMLQNQTNDRLRLLTVISTIFMPLALIAGVYGMNFKNMPELSWSFGYFGILGIMVVVASAMLLLFYRAGWFR